MRKSYPSDLTNAQWAVLEPLLPPAQHGGRQRTVDLRAVLDGIFTVHREGCTWAALPHDLPPKSTVYDYERRGRDDGTWQRLLDTLRPAVRRQTRTQDKKKRQATPSAARSDSQTVKGTEAGGARGYEGGKKRTGRKRHIAVEPLGLLLVVVVTGAGVEDAAAAPAVLGQRDRTHYPRLATLGADGKYPNHKWNAWIKADADGNWELGLQRRPPDQEGPAQLPKRWVVERTFAWLGRTRRHRRATERRTESRAALLRSRAVPLLLQRLQPSNECPQFNYPRTTKAALPGSPLRPRKSSNLTLPGKWTAPRVELAFPSRRNRSGAGPSVRAVAWASPQWLLAAI